MLRSKICITRKHFKQDSAGRLTCLDDSELEHMASMASVIGGILVKGLVLRANS